MGSGHGAESIVKLAILNSILVKLVFLFQKYNSDIIQGLRQKLHHDILLSFLPLDSSQMIESIRPFVQNLVSQ